MLTFSPTVSLAIHYQAVVFHLASLAVLLDATQSKAGFHSVFNDAALSVRKMFFDHLLWNVPSVCIPPGKYLGCQ